MIVVRIYPGTELHDGEYMLRMWFESVFDAPDYVRAHLAVLDAAARDSGYAKLLGFGLRRILRTVSAVSTEHGEVSFPEGTVAYSLFVTATTIESQWRFVADLRPDGTLFKHEEYAPFRRK